MFQTDYGLYDGVSWERMCQIAFKRRYAADGYQEVPADPGDHGLDGVTRNGKAFQCYCPDKETTTKELHNAQKTKIRDDLRKLLANEKAIAGLIGGCKIKTWYLVTPVYRKNELVKFCIEQRDEYRAMNLAILDSDFEVLILDAGSFKNDIHYAQKCVLEVVDTKPDAVEEVHVRSWKEEKIDLVDNAEVKHTSRFSDETPQKEEKVEALVDKTVKHYLTGTSILSKWENGHPEEYETFQRIVSRIEEDVVEKCMLPIGDKELFYQSVRSHLEVELEKQLPQVSGITRKDLARQVVAKWIMECSLRFE